MSNILSQDEINALLMGVMDEIDTDVSVLETTTFEQEPISRQRHAEVFQHVMKYDFRRPNKFSKDLLRILKGFHDNMARLFSASLSVYLRQDVKVHLPYIEQHTYQEFIDDCNQKARHHILSFVDDQAILSFDIEIAMLMVEKILGGQGEDVSTKREDLTDIEMLILRNILDKLFQHQKESWGEVMKDLPRIISVETNPRVIHLVQPNDIVLKMVFEISIGDIVGIFTYCIPYIAIDHVLSQLIDSQYSRSKHQFIKKKEEMQHNLEFAMVDVSAELGQTEATVEEVIQLQIGDIIPLKAKKTESLLVKVGGLRKFGGELGVSDKHYAIKINNILGA
jgi:flagellar motor switch protein FliM